MDRGKALFFVDERVLTELGALGWELTEAKSPDW